MLLLAALLVMQAPVAPPRDAAPARDTQTYTIRGRVTDAVTGLPIRGAEIGVAPAQRERLASVGTLTDADGKWEVSGLPEGDYILSHSKQGYNRVRGVRIYSPVHVSAQFPVRDVDLVLMRGGVISGRVTDESGEPAAEVRVQALRVTGDNVFPVGRGDATDDRGEFRLYGLEPGEYFVAAHPGQRSHVPRPPGWRGPVATYYPAAVRQAQAERVTVVEQGEINDLALQLQTAPTATISGRIVLSGQALRHAFVRLREDTRPHAMFGELPTGMAAADGRFQISGVVAGEYIAHATAELFDGDREMGEVRVSVADRDVEVVLPTRKATAVSGRVISTNGAPVPAVGLRVWAAATEPTPFDADGDSAVRPDGTFEVKSFSSRAAVRVVGTTDPMGWRVRDLIWQGRSVLKSGLDLSGGPVTGVEVVMVASTARLQGTVRDAAGKPLAEGTVLIVPEDEQSGDPGDVVRAVVRAGEYVSRKLAPGRYRAMPIVETRTDVRRSGGLIALVRSEGQPIELGEHETATLSLTVSDQP